MQLKHIAFTFLALSISSCVSKKEYNELGQYYENIENDLVKAQKEIAELKQELALKTSLGEEAKETPITIYKFDKTNHDFGFIALG